MPETRFCVGVGLDVGTHALEVDVLGDGDRYLIRLAGEADCSTASLFELVLKILSDDLHAQTITLDMRELAFVSASCMGLIAGAEARMRSEGRRLVVHSPSTIVRRMLEICELSTVIEARCDDSSTESWPRCHAYDLCTTTSRTAAHAGLVV